MLDIGGNPFGKFRQRSAGPLWRLLKQCQQELGESARWSAAYGALVQPGIVDEIEAAVQFVNQEKHEKAESSVTNVHRPVEILANISKLAFAGKRFGFFEGARKRRFAAQRSYEARFRVAEGRSPFARTYWYEGVEDPVEGYPYIVDLERLEALPCTPLLFWDHCDRHRDLENGHCYLYDIPNKDDGGFSFKAVGSKCSVTVVSKGRYASIADHIEHLAISRPRIETLPLDLFREEESERWL